MLRVLFVLLMIPVAAFPVTTVDIAGRSLSDSLRERFDSMPVSSIEGIWQLTEDGGIIAIVRDDDNGRHYSIIAVDSPDRAVMPGSVMGKVSRLAKQGYYDGEIMTSVDAGGLKLPKRFTLHMNDDSHISFLKVNKGLRVNVWRLLPYMFRRSVREVDDRQRGLDGAVKIYPRPLSRPSEPRYL